MYNSFSVLLKAIRSETGLTQSAFAEKLGVSAILIAMLETGQKEPTKRFIEKLAHKMRVSPQSLIPFIYNINEFNRDNVSALERQLVKLGEKLQEELIKKKARNILGDRE